jgi:hypothetical protein
MKVTLEDALSLLGKYADERTPVLAVFVTPSACGRRGDCPQPCNIVAEVIM